MRLTKEQEAAIIGMVLGDGYLQKTGKKNARLRLEHKADHKDYLIWKAGILPNLFQGKPTFLKRIHPITKKTYSYVRQQSNSSPILGKFRDIFYVNNKKIIPEDIDRLLKTDIAFAIWFLDDGYYYFRDNCAYLYLGKVSRHGAEIASQAIFNKFNIENRVLDKKNKGFAVYFPPKSQESIKIILKKYTPSIMAYKIPS